MYMSITHGYNIRYMHRLQSLSLYTYTSIDIFISFYHVRKKPANLDCADNCEQADKQ